MIGKDAVLKQPAGRFTPRATMAASIMGLLVLAATGWAAWSGAVRALGWLDFDSPLALAVIGFVTGTGAFFAPCAFVLFPAYISYYLARPTLTEERLGRSLVFGLTCAAGSILFFAIAAVAITAVGGAASRVLIAAKPVIALGVVALGLGQLFDVRFPSLALPIGVDVRRLPWPAALFLYGFGYALATTGCTLPIYVSLVVLPLTSGTGIAALTTFASFAVAIALMMLLTSVLVGLAKDRALHRLETSTVAIKRGSGVVLIGAGLYLGYYYITTGM